jgi:hypothetical protein
MVTIDHSALVALCIETEMFRSINSEPNFGRYKPPALILRGIVAVSINGTSPVIEPVHVNASAEVSPKRYVQKLHEGRGTCVEPLVVAFVMFREESLNKAIEIIYAYYLLYKREKNFPDMYKKIAKHAECNKTTRQIARKFFTSLS